MPAPALPAVTDWHAHWVPPEALALLACRTVPPCLVTVAGTRRLLLPDGRAPAIKEAQLDLDTRRAALEKAGIDRQILSLAVIAGQFPASLPAESERAVCEAANRGFARISRESGDRFGALAALPTADPGHAARMLEIAVTEQGLAGGTLPADAFVDDETAARFRPVLAAAQRLRTQIFIHPGPLSDRPWPPADDSPLAMIRRRAVGFQDSLTAAAITFEYSDLLDSYPDVRVRLANLAGTFPLIAERIAVTARRMNLPDSRQDGRPHRLLADTASFGAAGLSLAARTFGAERLVFGTDCPALPLTPALDGVGTAAFSEAERIAVLRGDALG